MKKNEVINKARALLEAPLAKPKGDLKVYKRALAIITEKLRQSIGGSR